MTTSTLTARLVRVRIEEGKTGLFYATSPDLKGLLVAESTIEALEKAIPKTIRSLYAACQEDMLVTRMAAHHEDYIPWVAIPSDLAREALSS